MHPSGRIERRDNRVGEEAERIRRTERQRVAVGATAPSPSVADEHQKKAQEVGRGQTDVPMAEVGGGRRQRSHRKDESKGDRVADPVERGGEGVPGSPGCEAEQREEEGYEGEDGAVHRAEEARDVRQGGESLQPALGGFVGDGVQRGSGRRSVARPGRRLNEVCGRSPHHARSRLCLLRRSQAWHHPTPRRAHCRRGTEHKRRPHASGRRLPRRTVRRNYSGSQRLYGRHLSTTRDRGVRLHRETAAAAPGCCWFECLGAVSDRQG
mmetsp:Transcript_59915/g.177653  ORF Transcript_59915/g.177653 Transcript_59915/m.177653 type:complete len:267 (+) Transcript_59915:333-1133(+)